MFFIFKDILNSIKGFFVSSFIKAFANSLITRKTTYQIPFNDRKKTEEQFGHLSQNEELNMAIVKTINLISNNKALHEVINKIIANAMIQAGGHLEELCEAIDKTPANAVDEIIQSVKEISRQAKR